MFVENGNGYRLIQCVISFCVISSLKNLVLEQDTKPTSGTKIKPQSFIKKWYHVIK